MSASPWKPATSIEQIYPDARHGAPFQCHEEFVPQALAFLAR